MNVLTEYYPEPPFCNREILRYAGAKDADESLLALLDEVKAEIRKTLRYEVCYLVLPVKVIGGKCDFENFAVYSENLAKHLKNVDTVVVFAATVGVGVDRLIEKYGRIAPSKAVFAQAIGAERIETLCDVFSKDVEEKFGMKARARFSPGYGDLPLETQREIFRILDCKKRIGLTLNDSLLMSPSKSVTAFVGLEK